MTTLRDAVELGVACFVGMKGADEDALVDRLLSLGVAPWLAVRLVTWLPVAFGRRLLPDVDFPADYGVGDARLRFEDDPVFAAVQRRVSESVTRPEMEVIGLRSAEVSVANAYLTDMRKQGRIPDLSSLTAAIALPAPLPALEPGDGGIQEPRDPFHGFLQGHGLGEAVTNSCDAFVYPRVDGSRFSIQVDFAVKNARLAGGRLLESFGGFGSTWQIAVGDVLRKFERGSLHVLIAGVFDERACADQVEWERWPHPSGERRVCLGPQLMLYGDGAPPIGPLLDRLRGALTAVPLRPDAIHALRVFTMREGARSHADEVLLDGESWEEGRRLCSTFEWPRHVETVWGTRLFALLLPLAQ